MLEQIILLLGLAGFVVSLHIFLTKKQGKQLVCNIGKKETCNDVVNSVYNKTLGIPNEILGMLYYFLVIVLSGLIIYSSKAPYLSLILLILGSLALLASIYFTYLQGAVLKKWCQYCVTSALITLLILIFELFVYF